MSNYEIYDSLPTQTSGSGGYQVFDSDPRQASITTIQNPSTLASGMSLKQLTENLPAGVGKQLTDWLLAAQQHVSNAGANDSVLSQVLRNPTPLNPLGMITNAAVGAGNLFGMKPEDWKALDAQLRQQAIEKQRIDEPLMRTTGGFAGMASAQAAPLVAIPAGSMANAIGSTVGSVLPRVGAALGNSTLLEGGLQGALQGGMQPDTSSPGSNQLIGALAGVGGTAAMNVLGKTIGSLATAARVPEGLDAAKVAAINWAREHGMPLTSSDIGGGEWFKRFERMLAASPFAGSQYAKIAEGKGAAINDAMRNDIVGNVPALYEKVGALGTVSMDQAAIDNAAKLANPSSMFTQDMLQKAGPLLNTAREYAGTVTPSPEVETLAQTFFKKPFSDLTPAENAKVLFTAQRANLPLESGNIPRIPVGTEIPIGGQSGNLDTIQAIRTKLGDMAYGNGSDQAQNIIGHDMINVFDDLVKRGRGSEILDVPASILPKTSWPTSVKAPDASGNIPITVSELLTAARSGHQINLKTARAGLPAEDQTAGSTLANSLITDYSPARLATAINNFQRQTGPGGFKSLPPEKQAALTDLSNVVEQFKQPNSSGTAENFMASPSMLYKILGSGASLLGGAAGAGFGAQQGGVPGSTIGGLAGIGLNPALAALLLARANPGAARQFMTPNENTSALLRQLAASGAVAGYLK